MFNFWHKKELNYWVKVIKIFWEQYLKFGQNLKFKVLVLPSNQVKDKNLYRHSRLRVWSISIYSLECIKADFYSLVTMKIGSRSPFL